MSDFKFDNEITKNLANLANNLKNTIKIPKLDTEYDLKNFNFDLDTYRNIDSSIANLEPIDIKEASGMNDLINVLVTNQQESIAKQNETINIQSRHIESLATIISQNNQMIKDANKGAREARVYSIVSILIAIFAIVMQYV